MAKGTRRESRANGRSVPAMAGAGKVAKRSEAARTGAMTEKLGTHPAIVRLRPAAAAAILTGLSS